ncbi:MAG TPA: ATP-binding cassette domain-containing protein [Pyrinomonadaceae bacterium]|jgi:branched-chain amino acid transport system ATP-binding protein
MLQIQNLSIKYDGLTAVDNASLEIVPGEIAALVGANGAGKSSIGKAIAGLVRPTSGQIRITTADSVVVLTELPGWKIARSGIVYVPEAKPVFADFTVKENLQIAFSTLRLSKHQRERQLNRIYEMFPLLKQRSSQLAATLSGGQRRILSIAKALLFISASEEARNISNQQFQLLIFDEPTTGLDPSMIVVVKEILLKLNSTGLTLLIIEQMASFALNIAHRGYLMQRGSIVANGDAESLLRNPAFSEIYLSISREKQIPV